MWTQKRESPLYIITYIELYEYCIVYIINITLRNRVSKHFIHYI